MAGIYIHIPFCRKICHYCDFYRVTDAGSVRQFVKAVISEAQLRAGYLGNEEVSTIYFGGGTPSTITPAETARIIKKVRETYNVLHDAEITIEINPDDADRKYYNGLIDAGINRISLGVQSWRDTDLRMLNRRHDAAGAERAILNAIAAGFNNVTVDLIYGLPGMSLKEWEENLDRTLSYDIKHISAYHLTIEKGTVFGKMKEQGLLSEPEEEESNNQFLTLIEKTAAAGFIHYEISNFGKEGYFSRHNTNYWRQVNYLGLGPSAHSFNGFSRQWNIPDIHSYLSSLPEKLPPFEMEELDLPTRFNEYMMTSLRTMWGADLEFIEKNYEKEGYDYVVNTAARFLEYGLMRRDKKNLVLTDQGKMISDNIISEFMMTP